MLTSQKGSSYQFNSMVVDMLTDPVIQSLDNAGIAFTICDSVDREPTVGMFEDISSRFDLKAFDSVIAVGGGSVIDMSRGLAVLGSFGGSIIDYDGFYHKE